MILRAGTRAFGSTSNTLGDFRRSRCSRCSETLVLTSRLVGSLFESQFRSWRFLEINNKDFEDFVKV